MRRYADQTGVSVKETNDTAANDDLPTSDISSTYTDLRDVHSNRTSAAPQKTHVTLQQNESTLGP